MRAKVVDRDKVVIHNFVNTLCYMGVIGLSREKGKDEWAIYCLMNELYRYYVHKGWYGG